MNTSLLIVDMLTDEKRMEKNYKINKVGTFKPKDIHCFVISLSVLYYFMLQK